MSIVIQMLGIVLLRFRPLPRVWAVLLIMVNAAAFCFLDTVYGQVALAAVGAALTVMAIIYAKIGFVRLLGVGHVFWFAMLPWLAGNLPNQASHPWLYRWVIALLAVNSISLVIDTIDVVRFLRGEREPHYRWGRQEETA